MFSGIIESRGELISATQEGSNVRLRIRSHLAPELKIDQSIAHNGVCLTVVELGEGYYDVVAIAETLNRSNLGALGEGDGINLERCLKANDRLDGHIVQGHVDQVGTISSIKSVDGSWMFEITFDEKEDHLIVEKGSICINGISLTVVSSETGKFSVAIIPYTYEHTNLHELKAGDTVNLEFDIVGKYIARMTEKRLLS